MKKKKLRRRMIAAAGIITLLIAFMYQIFICQQDVLGFIRQGEPAAAKLENLRGSYPSYQIWDEKGTVLGYAVITGSSGYGGKLNVLTIIAESGEIKSVSILEDHETPTYMMKVIKAGLLNKITHKNIQDDMSGVDAVSGATMTCTAILNAVQKAGAQIGNQHLGMNIPETQHINFSWKDIVTIGLLLMSMLACAYNAKKLRPWLLALSVIFIGFLCNGSLTFGNYISLLTGKLPVFLERPIWFVMVPGILIVTLLWGKNFYCRWLCPFGAVQEGLYHSLNLVEFSPSPAIKSKAGQFRWPILWLAALLALLFNNGQIAGYEPFPTFFNASGNTAQWILTMMMVLAATAQIRFWCHHFCPVGFVLNLSARVKQKLQRYRKVPKEQETSRSSPCNQCSGTDCAIVPRDKNECLGKQDKIFIGIAFMANLLIIGALLQNIMVSLHF